MAKRRREGGIKGPVRSLSALVWSGLAWRTNGQRRKSGCDSKRYDEFDGLEIEKSKCIFGGKAVKLQAETKEMHAMSF